MPLAIIILAAGKGTRMRDPNRAKVLYALRGVPLIDRVIRAASPLGAGRIVIVVGHQASDVREHVSAEFPNLPISFAEQIPQLGTGHAIMVARAALENLAGEILVLYGDVPLIRTATLESLVAAHRAQRAGATVLTANVPDPTGYGRMIRGANGGVERIVEQKDATDAERAIVEINSGIYVFDLEALLAALDAITPSNTQGEYYLTDAVRIIREKGGTIASIGAADHREILGVNSPEQLEEIEEYAGRIERR